MHFLGSKLLRILTTFKLEEIVSENFVSLRNEPKVTISAFNHFVDEVYRENNLINRKQYCFIANTIKEEKQRRKIKYFIGNTFEFFEFSFLFCSKIFERCF